MTARRTIEIPAEARDEVTAIIDAHAAKWDAIRAMNRHERPTGVMADAIFKMDESTTALEDQLRRRFFPRAARVTVDQWGVYTWSPTGRIVRQVWKIERIPSYE